MVNASSTSSDFTDVFGLTDRNRKTIQSIFSQFTSVKKVVLFGSRAVGTYKPYSDIDLCIMNADFDSADYTGLVAAFEESDLPFFSDLLVFQQLKNEELKQEILTKGSVLFCKADF